MLHAKTINGRIQRYVFRLYDTYYPGVRFLPFTNRRARYTRARGKRVELYNYQVQLSIRLSS